MLTGFSITAKLREAGQVLLCRGVRESDKREVVLKILFADFPSPDQISTLEAEFDALRESIGEGIPRALELVKHGNGRILVLESLTGTGLAAQMPSLSLAEKLNVASKLTSVLANLHSKGIYSRDLRPENLVYDRAQGRVGLIDLGLNRSDLAYISPEQTGRTQNGVDYRSDYYCLGLVLYELFSGQKPFSARDEMELVHAHIAVTETPLHQLMPKISQGLSLTVQKLMRKSPDERYQSALGILSDLKAIVEQPDQKSFAVGSSDVSSKFRLSAKLYGREREIKLVKKALSRVVAGDRRLILVSGDPGVGKSTLVNLTKEEANAAGGYFVFGKYDQYRKDVPFSALIHAFNQLVMQILTEDEASVAKWKENILLAMGENAAVVTAILPQVELIVGKCPPVPPLQGFESQRRFQQTFHSFIRACCLRGRPIVIFLDDLQWADSASRALIKMFLTEKGAESLLLIGAYRDGEISPTDPLHSLFKELDEMHIALDSVHLNSLSLENVRELLRDSFHMEASAEAQLAEIVFAKTDGNPFFASQFLRMLYDKKYLRFQVAEGWVCDFAAIRTQDATKNVLTLLGQKIANLSADHKSTLELAACFGNYFKLSELKIYDQRSESEVRASLEAAAAAGLIVRLEGEVYKFIHDRVQEVAYSLMSVDERMRVHWEIANRLLQEWPLQKQRAGIFYLVNHWNAGAAHAKSLDARVRGAGLNLIAATRARESSVYDLALAYALAGLSLFKDDEWNANVALLAPLMQLRATCEFTLGQNEAAEKTFHQLLQKTIDPIEKSKIYRTMAALAHMQGKNAESLGWAMKGFKTLNEPMPRNPSKLRLLLLMLKCRKIVRKLIEVGPPKEVEIINPRAAEIFQLLYACAAPSYSLNKNFLVYVTLRAVVIAAEEGFLALNPCYFFTTLLWSRMGDFKTAKQAESFLYDIIVKTDPTKIDGRCYFAVGAFSRHVLGTFKESLRMLEKGIQHLTLMGDILYAGNCMVHAGMQSILSERKLSNAEMSFEKYWQAMLKLNYPTLTAGSVSARYWLSQMQGGAPLKHEGRELTYEVTKEFVGSDKELPWAWFSQFKLFVEYFHGRYDLAYAYLPAADMAEGMSPFSAISMANRVICALLRLRYLRQESGFKKWTMHRHIRKQLKFFRKLSEVNPTNYRTHYLILLGEFHASRGHFPTAVKHLQEAVRLAKAGEVVLWEGIANELLAEVFFKQGLDKVGLLSVREALFVYQNWGANPKVAQIFKRFPELSLTAATAIQEGSTLGQTLDMNTVLKATNTLISEIDMSQLVHKMLSILIENAGAERAVLFLNEGRQLVARGDLSVHGPKSVQLQATPFESFLSVPRAMMTYAVRTHETMVLENASADDRLGRDEYVKQNRVLSAVALPIMGQGELRGVVYLENNVATGVFSPQRVEMMKVLSGQIAISLENARLYQQQGEAIRMQNELVTAHAVQEMLFPQPKFATTGVNISGYYQPATECGGDWWCYSQIGDWVYVWIGDATGHGAPAALVTSAACSAVALLETDPTLTPEKAMAHLNKAVFRTTKGQISMTFFVGALNRLTGEFRYVRASHEAPLLLRKEKHGASSLRAALEPLMGKNGASLGEVPDESYEATSIYLKPGDRVVLYTDGLPELNNRDGRQWGERGFWECAFTSSNKGQSVEETANSIVAKAENFRGGQELLDDITLCVLEFTGEASDEKIAA